MRVGMFLMKRLCNEVVLSNVRRVQSSRGLALHCINRHSVLPVGFTGHSERLRHKSRGVNQGLLENRRP